MSQTPESWSLAPRLKGKSAPFGSHFGAAAQGVGPHAGEGSAAHIVVGHRESQVQVEHRMPPPAWHKDRLTRALHAGLAAVPPGFQQSPIHSIFTACLAQRPCHPGPACRPGCSPARCLASWSCCSKLEGRLPFCLTPCRLELLQRAGGDWRRLQLQRPGKQAVGRGLAGLCHMQAVLQSELQLCGRGEGVNMRGEIQGCSWLGWGDMQAQGLGCEHQW